MSAPVRMPSSARVSGVGAGIGASELQAKTKVLSETIGVDESLRQYKLLEALRTGDKSAVDQYMTSSSSRSKGGSDALLLAVQCADLHTVQHVVAKRDQLDVNERDINGNTALHLAAQHGRMDVVDLLMDVDGINDTILNNEHRQAYEVASNADIALHMQTKRGAYIERVNARFTKALGSQDGSLEELLDDPRTAALLDTNRPIDADGNTALHSAVLARDISRIQLLLSHGADPFPRNKRNKTPIDLTKDDRIKALFKNLPQRTMLNNSPNDPVRYSGHLKKWTNYKSGYKARWFLLENGVLSYYRNKDDTETACRGSINLKVARIQYSNNDKTKFSVLGTEKNGFHLKAAHPTEAKNWIWHLNQAKTQAKDAGRLVQPSKDLTGAPIVSGESSTASLNIPSSPLATQANPFGSSSYTPSIADSTVGRGASSAAGGLFANEIAPEDNASVAYSEAASEIDDPLSHEEPHGDAFAITANAAKLQLQVMDDICAHHVAGTPTSDETIQTFRGATAGMREMLGKLIVMVQDRERYFRSLIDREQEMRRLWEDNMQALATDQDDLERKVHEAHQQRRATIKALRAAQTQLISLGETPAASPGQGGAAERTAASQGGLLNSNVYVNDDLGDEDDTDDEFYDAEASTAMTPVASHRDAELPAVAISAAATPAVINGARDQLVEEKAAASEKHADEPAPAYQVGTEDSSQEIRRIEQSFRGYSHPIRTDMGRGDDRPTVSLWGILKSMIGKDMTKMTLPVSFNEATSLLQRVAEDMEYTDLLDHAATLPDAATRALYVAAFAASEYASTIDRVAKPFNPLLHETYEYVRPDKRFRFVVEQVSHHPPIGAAHAESPLWEYWGESSVKSKFNGKSFDINPLGTWYLRLKLPGGKEELYTWKKVNTAVVGILLGSPTVDNYGPMVVTNHTHPLAKAELDFKARGWRGAGAYKVDGTVTDEHGSARWNVAGKWNERLTARSANSSETLDVWSANPRPSGVPFNLTTFAMSLNALDPELKPYLPQTDTRLRPDQRAMENGEYDFAAKEKNRLEEKQRAVRRQRERDGIEPKARWFEQRTHPVTNEQYWHFTGDYWLTRERVASGKGDWQNVEDIF
ncbi:hypothetical protein PYCC9005_000920 [Savitreella phatthalungensis]